MEQPFEQEHKLTQAQGPRRVSAMGGASRKGGHQPSRLQEGNGVTHQRGSQGPSTPPRQAPPPHTDILRPAWLGLWWIPLERSPQGPGLGFFCSPPSPATKIPEVVPFRAVPAQSNVEP